MRYSHAVASPPPLADSAFACRRSRAIGAPGSMGKIIRRLRNIAATSKRERLKVSFRSVRRSHRHSLLEDCLWVDVDAFTIVATTGDVESERSVHDSHGREKSLAVAQRTENRPAVRLEKIRHVKALHVACREITVHLAPSRRSYHADVVKHSISLQSIVQSIHLGSLPCRARFQSTSSSLVCETHQPRTRCNSTRGIDPSMTTASRMETSAIVFLPLMT